MKALVYSPRDLAVANPINAAMGVQQRHAAAGRAAGHGHHLEWRYGPGGQPGIGILSMPPSPVPPLPTGGGVAHLQRQRKIHDQRQRQPAHRHGGQPAPVADWTGRRRSAYTSGQSIHIDGWSINLKGSPKAGDTVTIGNAKKTPSTATTTPATPVTPQR